MTLLAKSLLATGGAGSAAAVTGMGMHVANVESHSRTIEEEKRTIEEEKLKGDKKLKESEDNGKKIWREKEEVKSNSEKLKFSLKSIYTYWSKSMQPNWCRLDLHYCHGMNVKMEEVKDIVE